MKRDLFNIGDFLPSSSTASPVLITDAAQLEDLCPGDLISPLGDYLMEWDQDCLPPSTLEQWRHEGDELCDEVVEVVGLRPGQDGLQVLLAHLERPIEAQASCVRAFWQQISSPPPYPLSAFPSFSSDAGFSVDSTPRLALSSPSYTPAPTVSQGQAVFWRYSSQIFSALLHFSLAGGFSAVRIVAVLRETGYLTGNDRDKTYQRLLETTQAILDYMNDLAPVTGIGWKSAIRVRMLHASVRMRLRRRSSYDAAADGLPINQEDMLATLGSFAIAPLWSLRRMGIRLTPEEEAAYLAVWRHVGYYLGISPARLEQYYTGPHSVSRASKLFACMTMHLFDLPQTPLALDPRSTNTYRLLSAVTGRPPRPMPISYHLATSRLLLGDGLADRLSLPRTSRATRWQLRRAIWLERALVAFGRRYRTGWEVERVLSTRMLVSMVVCWQLGVRRTRFTIKAFGADMAIPTMVDPVEDGAAKINTNDNIDTKNTHKTEMKNRQVQTGDAHDDDTHPHGEAQTERKDTGSTAQGTGAGRSTAPSEDMARRQDQDSAPAGPEREKKPLGPDDDDLDPDVTMGVRAGRRIVARWRWLLVEMAVVVLGISAGTAYVAWRVVLYAGWVVRAVS